MINSVLWETSTCLILTGIYSHVKILAIHISGRKFKCLCDCFMNRIVDSSTRIRIGQRPITLDLVLSNIDDHISNVNVASAIGRSDHGMINFHINLHNNNNNGYF